jgi:hypothetical protein
MRFLGVMAKNRPISGFAAGGKRGLGAMLLLGALFVYGKCGGEGSFALSGLVVLMAFTHGLRRGLHSCAASRLGDGLVPTSRAETAREMGHPAVLGSPSSQPFRKGRGKSGVPDFVVVELSEWVGSHLDPAPPNLSAKGAERVGHPILLL